MGGLNSGPGPGITLLIAFVLILCSTVLSAPLYEEDDTQDSNAQGVIEPQGCYYNFQHYNEGERILTNEPCLNCTCRNRMLMCYLRVCPFTKGIGQNCTVEKVPGQCCPIITCPEVPVQLLTSSTTEHSEDDGRRPDVHHGIKGTAVGHLDNNGCQIDGVFYPNGAQVPGNPEKPCELCYCIRNKTSCIMQACALHVDGCRPIYEDGQCFPVRYQCDDQPYEEEPTTTIRPAPTPGLIITTTSSEPLECYYNNEIFEDGSRIQTEDPCEHCYCLKGKIACAVQECGAPLEKEGQNCTALPPAPGKCCPDSYQCDITMSSQKFGQGTTEAGFPSVADAGHPTDGLYPGEHGGTKTTEKPKFGTNEQSGDVTEGLTPEAVTPSKGVSGKPSVTPDGQGPHMDKEQSGTPDSSDLEHHKELDKGTQLPTKHQDSLPNEYEGTPEDVSSVPEEQKVSSTGETKPGITKRPVYDTRPETVSTIPGSLNDPIGSVHHMGGEDKPHGQKPGQYGDEKAPVSGSKPQEPSSADGTKVQDGIQTTQGSGHPTTESEHILHIMEQQKPAPGIESHVQDTSSTRRPYDEGLSTVNVDSTEKTGSTKPGYDGQWKPQPGIYQPDLQGTPFDVSQGQTSPDRTKPVFPGSDKLPGDDYGYSTPIPAIDEDQKGPMTVSNAKDQLIDKLHNIIQDVQAQVNDGKTTEMPEEADYKTTTQSQKGHFTEKPDTIPHLHHGSQESLHPLGSGHDVPTNRPTSDKETQQGGVTDTPKETSDIFNKIQGIIHGMFTQVTETVQTTLAPLTGDVDGKKPSKVDEESSSASPDTTQELKPSDGASKHPEGTKPTGSHEQEGVVGAPDDSDKRPQGSGSYYPQGSTKYPGYTESTTRKHGSTQTRYPDGSRPEDSEYPSITQYPDYISPDGETGDYGNYPEGSKPTGSGKYPHGTEHSDDKTTDSHQKRPEGFKPSVGKPHDDEAYPHGTKPTASDNYPFGTEYPQGVGVTGRPQDHGKYPTGKPSSSEKYPHYPHGTENPDEVGSTVTPDEFGKYPDGISPVKGSDNVKYPDQTGSTDRPHYSTKYPGSKYPEGITGKPIASEDHPYGTEYPEGVGLTGRPQDHGKYPEGTASQKYPQYPHGTEYPDEVGSTVTPDEVGKYPDGTIPVKGSEGVKYPGQTGSTGKPHYSTKYPEGVTGKPAGSEDQPYGTEYPEGVGVTGRPEDHSKYPLGVTPDEFGIYPGQTGRPHYSTKYPGSKYPEGITGQPFDSYIPHGTKYPEEIGVTGRPQDHGKYPDGAKPSGSEKYPHYPQGTEYPDEIGSTVTPDEFGKYPDGSVPVKGSEGVKYPGQTDRPHYSTKYPGSKYPEGFTGKPSDSEDQPFGTQYPNEFGVTGRPQDHGKYPEGTKPSGSEKYPHSTEYPEGIGSTITPDQFGKYPDQLGSTGEPHYSTKYPGSKYPEGVTGKPSDSDYKPHGTEYPGVGSTGRPQDLGKYPEGSKPSGPQKYPQGTEYPDEIVSTTTPDEFGKYPDGTTPVKGSGGVKYPGQTGSTGKPHYSTKYPSGEYPEGVTGKPSETEDQPYGTEYPGVGATGKPQYPEGVKPSDSERPYGTEYPEGETGTDRPYDSSKHPEGTKPVRGPDGVVYPGQTGSTGVPQVGDLYSEGTKRPQSEKHPLGSEYPDKDIGTDRPYGGYPSGFRPNEKYPGGSQPTGTEWPEYSTTYPNEYDSNISPDVSGKFPHGSKPRPDGTKYPDTTGRPHYPVKYPEGFDPAQKPLGSTQHFGRPTGKPFGTEEYPYATDHPEGQMTGKPHGTGFGSTSRPDDPSKYPYQTEYPEGFTGKPEDLSGSRPIRPGYRPQDSKYPTGSPFDSTRFPVGSRPTFRPIESGKYPELSTQMGENLYGTQSPYEGDVKPQTTGKHPSHVSRYPDGSKPTDSGKHPETDGSEKPHDSQTEHPVGFKPVTGKYPEGLTDKPYDLTKYPQGSKPSDKYPFGTEYPEGLGSTAQPNEFGKYPDGTSPVKGSEGVKHPDQTGTSDRPHYSTKYPGSKYPEGVTGKPSDTEDQPYGTKYPGVGVTGRPQGTEKYPEGSKPSHSDSERPYGTEYPEGETGTDRPYDSSKYPDRTKPEGVSYPGQTGSTGRPQYSTKYPGSKVPEGVTNTESEPLVTKYPEDVVGTGRPEYSEKYPEKVKPVGKPDELGKYPDESKPSDVNQLSGEKEPEKHPEGEESETDRPYDSSKRPAGYRPNDKYPEGLKPTDSEENTNVLVDGTSESVTDHQVGSTERPDLIKHSEEYKPTGDTQKHPDDSKPTDKDESKPDTNKPSEGGLKPEESEKSPDDTESSIKQGTAGQPNESNQYSEGVQPTSSEKYPSERGSTTKPDEFEKHPEQYVPDRPDDSSKYPEGTKPDGVKEPTQTGSSDKPSYSTKYPGSKYPEGVTGKPIGSEDQPYGTEYPEGDKLTGRPHDLSKYPEGSKPTSQEHPQYPDEVGTTLTPDEFGKYPDGISPVKGPEGVKYPGQTGSTGKPHYSTKYPGSKYPEGITGKPSNSEDQTYGTEYPEGVGVTERPQDHSKYPEGSKPSGSEKQPQDTEYPDVLGSTVAPDQFGKYPDETSPVKGSEGVKYPGQTESTGKPHYSTKYPESNYPEGVSGKPTGSEDQPYGTEYPEGVGVTGRPQDHGKYPEGTKPSGSQKYPHGTEYPNEVGSTVTPDEFGKYPDGSAPVKGSEEEKYTGQTGPTGKPHYSTKYPGSKYPEGVTGKPIGSEDRPYGTEYPEGDGVTGRPQGLSKYPEGSKPSGPQKYPQGTEYPDEIGSTVTPDEFGKYPDGTTPVKGSEGVKYPGQTGSTGKPHYSTKYPSGEYPEGVTGKPSETEDQPYGTEYPEGVGATGRPQYPEGVKPSDSERPYGTEYPEGETGTDRPYDSSKYPEGTKPVRGPDGVVYPGQTGSTGRPIYSTHIPDDQKPTYRPEDTNKLSEGVKPMDEDSTSQPHGSRPNEKYPVESQTGSDHEIYTTEYPEDITGTKPHDPSKYPEGSRPSISGQGPEGEKYPDSTKVGEKPQDPSKYPEGTHPEDGGHYPHGTEYPDQFGNTGKPYDPEKSTPHSHVTKYPEEETGTVEPNDFTKHPYGSRPSTKYPGEFKPTGQDLGEVASGTKQPEYTGSSLLPQVTSKYPVDKETSGKPEDSNELPEEITPTEKRPGPEKDQSSNEYPNEILGTDKPYNAAKYPEGSKPHYTTKHPAGTIPSDLESMSHSTKHPHEPDGKPEDFGKDPVHEPEGVTKYPGKPQNLLPDIPADSEDQLHGTEPTDEAEVTGRPQNLGKYPEGSKPTSQKHPHYPQETEYPDEIGTTVTPDEFGKYPDGTSPVKGPEGVKYSGQTGSTGKPHYPTKYPGSKYPEGITSKPTGSEDQPYGTEYPEVGSTGRPQDLGKYPEGSKPTTSQKHPHYPHGTEYPDETGTTVTPDDFGKYPDGTSPVKGPEGVKYPGSTGRPHYSTKYPGSKYPEGITGKPDSEDQPLGTEYPEGFGVTKLPQGLPDKRKPTYPGERPYGTEYPEEEMGTDKPYDSNEYPEGTKPVRGPDGVKYPDETGSTGRPQYPDIDKHPDYNRVTDIPFDTNKFPAGTRPEDSEGPGSSTKRPDGTLGTTKSHDSSKYPEGVHPSTSGYDVNEGSTEIPFDSTKYPEGGKPSLPQHTESGEDADRPHDKDKHPEGVEPGVTEKHPDVSKYPSGTESTNELGSIVRPESGLTVGFKPTDLGRPSDLSHPEGATDSGDFKPTDRPHHTGKYPEGVKPTDSDLSSLGTKYPDGFRPSSTPHDSDKYPEGVTPSLSEKHPEDIGGSRITVRPDGVTEYPEGLTGKPHYTDKHPQELGATGSGDTPYGTEYPEEGGSSKYPDKFRPTGRPHGSTDYPEGSKPSVTDEHSTVYPYGEGSTGRPNDLGKYPEGVKPTDFEKYPLPTKYPEEVQSTIKPDEFGKYPEETRPGTKPHGSEKYPESGKPTYSDKSPSGTEYPTNEVESTVTPDEFGKYPDAESPVKGSESVKYPEETGSTGRPQYSTKYPGSKYPEGFTGKPTGSEDQPYGTEYPEGDGVTGRPQDHSKYPEGTKPPGSEKYPHGTEYPDEVGTTITPDEIGKYPDGVSPVKGSEGVKHPDQFGSTGKPHYSTKYPGSKYPEGVTGKPYDTEKQPHGTEYPEEFGSTGRPQDLGKYPEGTEPSGSQKYPHGTEYPDEVGSTVTPDKFGKYPDGTIPVKGSEGDQTGTTGRPHYSTKYPEEVTGKPTGSEDEPYGTEYPQGVGVTGRPQDHSKYPLGVTPDEFEKHPDETTPEKGSEGEKYPGQAGSTGKPHYSTKYPDEVGSTVTPDEFGKYPDGTSPVKGPEGVKYPGQTGSTGKPHYSTKYPGSKYPEGITGKPSDSEDQTFGTEYPEGVGVTGRPQDHSKYPDLLGSTVTPDQFGKYPDETSPVKGSEGVKYPGQTESTGKPHYPTKYPESNYPEGVSGKPTGSEDQPYGTEYPEEVGVTGRPQDHGKYPEGTKPSGSEKYPYGTEYPEEVGSTLTPDEFGKYPDGTSPVKGSEGVKYPDQFGTTGKPYYSTKYPGSKYPEGVTGKPSDSDYKPLGTEYPEGVSSTGRPQDLGKYPEGSKPSGPQKYPQGTEYPDEIGSTATPGEFGKYPDGTTPVKGSEGVKYPGQTGSTGKPHYSTKYPAGEYPEGVTGKPSETEDQPYGTEYPGVGATGKPQYPEGVKPSDSERPYGTEYPEGETGTDRPYDSSKYPEGTKPVRGPDGVVYPGQTGSTGKPQSGGETPEEGKPISEDKYPDGVKPTTPKDSSFGGTPSSTPDTSVYDSISKQPGSMYLPQSPQSGKPISATDDKDKPLELPEESDSVKPGHDSYGSSTPKGPESDGLTDKPGVPVSGQSIDEMDVTTHSPDEYPKRPDSADLTHDPEYKPQSGDHSSKRPSTTQYPTTDEDGKVAPQGVKGPQDDLLATRPGSESPHTEKTSPEVSTPKHGSSETEKPLQGVSGPSQPTLDGYGFPIKHPDDKQGSTSPGDSESSDEYSTTEYSNQDGVTGKPSGTHTKRPTRPGQDVYTTQQPSEGRPTHGVGHPEGVSPGSEGFDGSVYETTTLGNDDLINKLQSIISGIQTQVTQDKTTRQPSTSDLNAPFGQTTGMPHEGEQKPQDNNESVEYATDKPYVTGDKRRPVYGSDSTKPQATDKPLAGPVDELTTGLEEETTEGYLEEENEIHDPEGHFGKRPQSTKKPSSGSSTEFPETGRPTGTQRPGEETVVSQSTKHPEGYIDQSVQPDDKDKPTSSTDEYPEEGKRPDQIPVSGEKVTGKPDDSIHFPDGKPGSPVSESSTPGISDEHTPTRKTGSTQPGLSDVFTTTSYYSEKPEDYDSSTKEPGTHQDTRPTISQSETEDDVHKASSTPKDGVLGVTKTPETGSEPQEGVTKPGDRPGVYQPSKPGDETHPHGEENVPIYHGVESGKPTDKPESIIGEDQTVLPEEDSAGTKKPIHGVSSGEETGQVTESEMHPSHQEPTEKPLHVVYPTYYPDGIITRKPGSRPQDLGNKVTVTPQANVYGTSTPSKEDDDTTGDREVMKPTSKVPTDGSFVGSGEPVTEGFDTEGSTKRVVPQEGFTTGDVTGKPLAPLDKHPSSSVDETGTTSPVIIIEEVHTEVHSERATTKPGTESYDQTTKSIYPLGSETEKPETSDGKTTKNPDLFSPGTEFGFQEPGYGSTVRPLSTDRPQDSLSHTSQPSHGSSLPGVTGFYPDVGSTTDDSLYPGTGKPVYQTKHPESPDGKSTNEPGLVTEGTTPSADHSDQPGSQHIMHLYSPKDKYSTTISPELGKGTQQPGSFVTGSRVPGVTEEGTLYTTSKPDDSQGPTFDHEIFGSKFPGRKTTQKPLVVPESQPDFTTVFGVDTTREPQEGITSTPNVEHVPSFIFPQKQPEDGVTSTEGYITQGKPQTTVGQPGVVFEGKQTTPSYQFITSGTHDSETSTKNPFQPSVKGASYVPYKIIDGRKVYYPEREVAHKPDEADKHGFDGFDYLPYEIINGKKFFKPNEVVSQPAPTSTTPKHRLGMYVPYKIINGTKVYYTEDPQGKPQAGVEDYDGLDYVPFDIINGTKVFYPEAVNEPTSPTFQETTPTPSYILAMYVPYKVINGTKVYYPEDSPNKPENEDYDGLDYLPYEIVNGKKVFYPERVATPPKGTSTPSYVMAMYVPYKIINGTKVYYPEDPQGKPQTEDYDGLDYVPFEIVNGTKVFYPERVTATPEATTKPAHTMAMYVPYKIVNGTKVYYPEEPQVDSEVFDGLDYVPFEIVNGSKVFYPERVSTPPYESTTTPSYPSAMYVPYKIVDGRKVYYPKYAQYKPYKVPEGFVGFDYIPYEIVNGSKVFYPDRATTVRPIVPPTKHQGMYVPYKIVNGTKIYYPKDAEEKPQGVLDGYDGSDYVPYEIVNGTQVFYPERATTEKPGVKAMYVPYKIVDGTKVYYAKDAQPRPNLIPTGYDGFDFVPYEIVNGTKTFYPERVTTSTPTPNELYYMQGMYVPYKIVDGRKVYYPQRAQHNPLHIPEGFEGFDYILYDIVNGTKVFHPERVTASPVPTHAPSGTFYPQGMYVPFRVINGTKVFYPQDAQHRPDPMKNDYDGWQHLPYDIVNGTKVFYPERVTTETPLDTMSAMYVPFKMVNGTKVFYVHDAQYQPHLIPEGYDGFEYVPYEIVNGTKKFYPSSYYPTTAKPTKQGMFVPYKIINGAKVYYPKHASNSPRPPSSEYNGVDFIPYEVINGTKVFYPDRIQGPELETSGTQAMYVPYKLVNGTKVFYPKDAQFKPYLIPEGYDGFDFVPYEIKNGTKVFYPERLTVTQRPEQVPSQGMFVPYKMINGQKVYYPKEAQKRPHPLSNEYDGLDYIPYEIVNGTKVFYPEYVTQSADMSGAPTIQAMYVPYKIINGTKVFYTKYAQHKPHLVPDGYDGFEYVPYKIVNGTKFFYPDLVATKPQKLQGMYVPYKIINGTKVFYPKYAQPTLQQLPKGFDGIDYVPYELVNGTKVFYPEKATPSGVSGTPVAQALYVPYKIINGKKVFYPKYAVERPQTIPEGYDGFAYMPFSIVNGTKMFYPEQAKFPVVNKVPSLQGTFVPYKLLNSTKVFYPKYSNDESPRVPDGYDGVDYVPYESVNGTKVFYPELISPQASSGTSPVPGKYVPYKVVNGKKVFYPKEGKPQYPSGGVRYPYDGIVYVPYKSLTGTSPSRPENYPPFVTPEHSLYGQNSEIVYVDDDDESFRPQFISQSRPSQEGHIGHVPGEGSCFLNNKTYENNMEIPPVSPCQSRCRCINSIVRCVRIKCPPLPQTNTANCSPVYDEGSCCPTYSCDNDDLDYLTTTEYPDMVLTGSSSTVISFGQGFDSTTQFAVTDASPLKPQYGQDGSGDFSGDKPHPSRKPVTSDGQHPTDQYHIHRPQKPKPSEQGSLEPYDGVEGHPMPGEFSSEDDYDGEDEEPYGPGTCRYAGKVYVSAQQIPRDDPCDFCFCFRSDIICLQQSCPPPIPGCRDEPIQGFCCPRYECHVKMATLLNVTSTTTTTTTTLPPHFFLHPYKGSATRTGCFVQGKAYRVGQAIPSASGPCMDCICRGNGRMECEPKVCTPEPMIRKMIVPAENTTSPSSER